MRGVLISKASGLVLGLITGCITPMTIVEKPLNGQVITERDDFTGATSRMLKDMGLPMPPGEGRMGLNIFGSQDTGTPSLFSFYSISTRGWRFLQCHSVHFKANGQPLPVPGEARHRGSVLSRSVMEYVSIHVPAQTVRVMARASSLQVRVCNMVLSFTDEQLAMLAKYAGIQRVATSPFERCRRFEDLGEQSRCLEGLSDEGASSSNPP